MTDFDVAIIGLGPAGATLARLLPKNLRVIAFDKKSNRPQGFQKPCGGLLSPDAQKALARFDLTLPKDTLVDPQIFSVRTIDLGAGAVRHYQRFYINLDRYKFDRFMMSLIPEHIAVREDCVVTKTERCADGFVITYRSKDGAAQTFTAKNIVGADGAASVVRRAFNPDIKIRSYLAIQQWFSEQHQNPFYSCIFDPETSDCCSWSISKDSSFIFGGAFPKDRARERFETQKKKLEEEYGFKFGEPLRTEACLVLRPRGMRDFVLGGDGVFYIGEAAGFISPSSLEGISFAINSAEALAEAFTAQNPHGRYRKLTRGLRFMLVGKVLKCPFMYNPLLRLLVMKSGLQTIKLH